MDVHHRRREGEHLHRVGRGKSYKLALSCTGSSDCFKLHICIFFFLGFSRVGGS